MSVTLPKIHDNATVMVTNNKLFTAIYGSDPNTVIENQVLFLNGAYCNVVKTNAADKPYLLFDNPDAPLEEYFKCLDKINTYSNGSIVFVRDMYTCDKIPEKP
ncbi:uncharacterized protein LOC144148966 [Haemaphysalis longicornis]